MMKIGVVSSMQNVDKMIEVRDRLREMSHEAFVTNFAGALAKKNLEEIEALKLEQKYNLDAITEFWNQMQDADALLVLNLDKNGVKNYIGGNTLMEIGFAHVLK